MALNQGLSRSPTRKRRVPTLVIVALAAAMVILSIIAGYGWEMTGFGGSEVVKETTRYDSTDPRQPKEQGFERTVEKQNPRTIWDWIGLLGVGSAIALVGWVFARKQRERDEAIANDRAQEETLQAYLDQMSNLMIDQKLGKERGDSLEDAVRKVAQARTITTLLVLDKDHKRRCLKLVYELGLIKRPNPMIALNNAGLDRAELSELSLRDACLRRVDLRATNLSGADLNGSDLSEVDLRGADLRNADLSYTDLMDANLLPYDERHPAALSFHNLKDKAAGSSDAELRYARVKSYLLISAEASKL